MALLLWQYFYYLIDAATENVMLMVFRHGKLGNADVSWITGASAGSVFRSGDLFPLAGTKKFPSGQNTTTLTFNVSICTKKLSYLLCY